MLVRCLLLRGLGWCSPRNGFGCKCLIPMQGGTKGLEEEAICSRSSALIHFRDWRGPEKDSRTKFIASDPRHFCIPQPIKYGKRLDELP